VRINARSTYRPDAPTAYQALTDPADTASRIDHRHDPAEDLNLVFNDPRLAVPWPFPIGVQSTKDRLAPTLMKARLIPDD